jgi:hypothetical protein
MRVASSYGSSLALLLAGALVACSSADDQGGADASEDGLSVGPGYDATPTSDTSVDSSAPGATVRIAQLSADLGAIDFCYRPTGTTSWTGPIFATLHPPVDAGVDATIADATAPADAWPDATGDDAPYEDAGSDDASSPSEDATPWDAGAPYDAGAPIGVAFESLSTYVTLAGSGTFDVAIVESGSVSCATPLAVDRVTLSPAEHATLVVMGSAALDASAADALQVAAFADDLSVDASAARLRFIHAALGSSSTPPLPGVSIGLLFADQTTVAVAGDVEPGQAASPSSTPPVVDMLGYATVAVSTTAASIVMSAEAVDAGSDTTWMTGVSPLALAASSLHTAFVYQNENGVAVLYCEDLDVGGTSAVCTPLAAQ